MEKWQYEKQERWEERILFSVKLG